MAVSREISKKANKMWIRRQLFRQHMQHVYEQFCDALVGDDYKIREHTSAKDFIKPEKHCEAQPYMVR